MEEIHKKRILRNLNYLIEYTGSVESVCVHLISKDHLTIREYQEVKSHPSDEQKCTELFTKLIHKPNNSFEDLLEILEETGNNHVAKKLKVPCAEELLQEAEEGETDALKRKVEYHHVGWIHKILSQIEYTQWPNFMRRLLKYDVATINDLNRFASTNSHSELVYKTLDYWIARNGNKATLDILINELVETQLNDAAETLKETALKIMNS